MSHTVEPDILRQYTCHSPAQGYPRKGGKVGVQVTFTPELYKQVRAEAISRGWSISRMVNHLCEASIDGIE